MSGATRPGQIQEIFVLVLLSGLLWLLLNGLGLKPEGCYFHGGQRKASLKVNVHAAVSTAASSAATTTPFESTLLASSRTQTSAVPAAPNVPEEPGYVTATLPSNEKKRLAVLEKEREEILRALEDTKKRALEYAQKIERDASRIRTLEERVRSLEEECPKLRDKIERLTAERDEARVSLKDTQSGGCSCDQINAIPDMGTAISTNMSDPIRMLREYNCGYGPKPRITAYLMVGRMDDKMEQEYEAASLDSEEWYLPADDQYEMHVAKWLDEARLSRSITVGYIYQEKIAPWTSSHQASFTKSLFSLIFPEFHVRAIAVTKEGFPIEKIDSSTTKLLNEKYPHIITGTGFFIDRSLKEQSKEVDTPEDLRYKWTGLSNIMNSKLNLAEDRPVIVSFDHEPWPGNCSHEDIVINCKMDPADWDCNNIFQPHAVQWWFQRERRFDLKLEKADRRRDRFGVIDGFLKGVYSNVKQRRYSGSFHPLAPVPGVKIQEQEVDSYLAKKTSFLAFMVKHCDSEDYPVTAALRTALFDLLPTYKAGTAIGNCRKPPDTGDWRYLEGNNADILRPYKFAIAFESTYARGYHTEKLLNAIIARTVPVYFGHSETISKVFNPKRFIHCKFDVEGLRKKSQELKLKAEGDTRIDFVKVEAKKDLMACIDKIKQVDQDDLLWKSMVAEPMLPNNSIEGSAFDLREIAKSLRVAIERTKPHWLTKLHV
mmetsp:Transcript_12563/g.30925  ORF Transcript_12563/g.30925 Transcript_12563/m.30925 type:complete len:714 (-) Transcript_12563:117-2258(-)